MTRKGKELNALEDHFKQWQAISGNLRNFVAPMLKAQEQLQKSLQPIIEAQKAAQKSFEQQEKLRKYAQSFVLPKFEMPDISFITKQAQEFQKFSDQLVRPAFEQLEKSFRELPPRMREALLLLGRHGWYLDLEMPLPGLWGLKKALTEGNLAETEDALVEYFENRIDQIEKSIVERFPNRQKLINAAFNAHRREEYELSIPVLLAQTDGICKEVFDELFFMKNNGKPRTAKYVEQVVSDTFKAALLSPLSQTLPIGVSEKDREEGFNELNRHMVLHGESLDYGSKTNSLKAISLINYVSHVLQPNEFVSSNSHQSN